MNEENAKRLAVEERVRGEESRKNAEEERKHLKAEAEVHELRAILGLQGRS